jgi:protein-disulfide isomerase
MRKTFIFVCLAGSVFVAFGQSKKKKEKQTEKVPASEVAALMSQNIDYKMPGAPLPKLKLTSGTDSTIIITNEQLANDANLFIMTFNPTCDHCQAEATILKSNIFLFKKSKIVMVASPVMKEHLHVFEEAVNIKEFPSMQVTLDAGDYIAKTFTYQTLPQINIYNKERKLLKVFTGTTQIDSLKQYIE